MTTMHPSARHRIIVGLQSLSLLAALLVTGTASAAGWSYPAIKDYGPVHVWPQSTVLPDKRDVYKAVFSITGAAERPTDINRGLEQVARSVNAFAAAGVALDHLKFVLIASGPATPAMLDDAAYQARYHVENPNLGVLESLQKAGVRLFVCGNALAGMHFSPDEVAPPVQVALSALSTLIIFENKGYALMQP